MKYVHESYAINREIVENFEEENNISLDTEYKEFLISNNVCSPEPDCFYIKNVADITKRDEPDNVIQLFYGFSEKEFHTLQYQVDVFIDSGRISKDYLPIAGDPFGNRICLGVGEENSGAIYFWNHENEAYEDEEEMTLLADHFNTFLSSLTEDDEG